MSNLILGSEEVLRGLAEIFAQSYDDLDLFDIEDDRPELLEDDENEDDCWSDDEEE